MGAGQAALRDPPTAVQAMFDQALHQDAGLIMGEAKITLASYLADHVAAKDSAVVIKFLQTVLKDGGVVDADLKGLVNRYSSGLLLRKTQGVRQSLSELCETLIQRSNNRG